MNLFNYVSTIDSSFPKQESMELVKQALASNPKWRFAFLRAETDMISFSVRSKHISSFSAFCPDVTVAFNESGTGTSIQTIYRLKEGTRIMLPSVAAIMSILIIYNLIMTINGTFHGITIFLPPILLLLAVCLLSFWGMYLPSRDICYVIRTALQSAAVSE